MKNAIQRKILAAATVLVGCVTAHAYNLAWLDEKAADGVLFVTNTIADAGSCKSTAGAYYAFANSENWTDKEAPHKNAVYFNGGLQMRLDTANYSFPGEGFILTGESSTCISRRVSAMSELGIMRRFRRIPEVW